RYGEVQTPGNAEETKPQLHKAELQQWRKSGDQTVQPLLAPFAPWRQGFRGPASEQVLVHRPPIVRGPTHAAFGARELGCLRLILRLDLYACDPLRFESGTMLWRIARCVPPEPAANLPASWLPRDLHR